MCVFSLGGGGGGYYESNIIILCLTRNVMYMGNNWLLLLSESRLSGTHYVSVLFFHQHKIHMRNQSSVYEEKKIYYSLITPGVINDLD